MSTRYLIKLPSAAREVRRRPSDFIRGRGAPAHAREGIGSKAQGMVRLAGLGLRTPTTYVCTWDAYSRYCAGSPQLEQQVKVELASTLDLDQAYAVRSSANLEDAAAHSFAGQFASILDVQGLEALWEAVRAVWESARTPAVLAYLGKLERSPGELKMAVLIQEMVAPTISGVAFSRNPLTGLDEVVVEAVPGSGTALVQEGTTPQRWVDKWGEWMVQPTQTSIPSALIREVVASTRAIAKVLRQPADLEWVYDGQAVYWVQARAITALDGVTLYSNRIAREVLPGQIKPLVWSINVPLVNRAWLRLIADVIGPHDLTPHDLARSFYYRAYFNMSVMGRIFTALGLPYDALELLLGIEHPGKTKPSFRPTWKTAAHLPRLLWFVVDKLRFERHLARFLPTAAAHFHALHRDDLAAMNSQALLGQIDRLSALVEETAHFNIVVPLLMQVYHRLLAHAVARAGYDLTEVDVTQGLMELHDLNPNVHLQELRRCFAGLPRDVQMEIARSGASASSAAADDFRHALQEFVLRFGHLSDSGNDFSAIPWRENPALVCALATQPAAPDSGAGATVGFDDLALPGWYRRLLRPLYHRARRFRLYREQVSSLYTYGYGLFRDHFLALAEHLLRQGPLAAKDDIFFLEMDEVRQLVLGVELSDVAARVTQRRQEMEASRDISLPSLIYGETAPPLESDSSRTLAGTPTARGYYQGPVRVVRGLHEFDKVRPGDVLVIPYSDVGWSPLFAIAGAVIAESGGMLSHSSIVAREYNIPAVVSVNGACHLPDGLQVTVDGYRGHITLHASEPTTEA